MFIKSFGVVLLLAHFSNCGSTSSLPTLSSKIKRQSTHDFPPCLTTYGKHGRCKPLEMCYAFNAYVNDDRRVLVLFLLHSQCGFRYGNPKVCCPVTARDSEPEVTSPFVKTDLLPSLEECGISSFRETYDGEETRLGEFPWMVALEYSKYDERSKEMVPDIQCAGVLISKRYVLTAAQCVKEGLERVRLGEYKLNTNPDCDGLGVCAPKYLSVDIQESVIFKTYKKHGYHDIALLYLKEEVKFSDFIKPVCLPTTVEELYRSYVGQKVTVAGWGRTGINYYNDESLLKAEVPVVNASKYFGADMAMVFAGGEEGKGPCDGFSGAPLMIKRHVMGEARWYAIGVMSFEPIPCVQADQPSAYTRISKYMTWIEDNISSRKYGIYYS
ncbi:melanization protease 1-like [Zophobas morio]|uniref:melanization protease 1-like n=1 Tax=Zophobas morio TaxID=2755281 RepID=UPI003083B396